MTVTLRQRKKSRKISLYLDYYLDGNRKYEYLGLYLIPESVTGKLTKAQKDENVKILGLAESIRSKRHLEIQNGIYGFNDQAKRKGSFILYMETLAEKRSESSGNFGNWDSMVKHFKKFCREDVSFGQLDSAFVESFRDYLSKTAIKSNKKRISQNTAYSYYGKFKAALNQAVKDEIIRSNPADKVAGLTPAESQREFLTHEELQNTLKHDCEIPVLKKAFIFSCLTALRWSDIEKLKWSEIQYSNEYGWYIRFEQMKTKGKETLPISDQARDLLGEKGGLSELVFNELIYSDENNKKLRLWIEKAGITKYITFHCARHTCATLQLSLKTDLLTVSKLLGHKNIKTTQIYAKIIDATKREAGSKIQLDFNS
ncbi:MAG: integrase [Flavobacteriales bacterium]|jgi:integrase